MAFNNIGALYEGGDGTRLDYAQAANWYKKAVDLGEPIAMVDRGYQYENGHGVKKDCAEACGYLGRRSTGWHTGGDEQSRPALSAEQMRLPATMPRRAA
jgi:TPR repeat protein